MVQIDSISSWQTTATQPAENEPPVTGVWLVSISWSAMMGEGAPALPMKMVLSEAADGVVTGLNSPAAKALVQTSKPAYMIIAWLPLWPSRQHFAFAHGNRSAAAAGLQPVFVARCAGTLSPAA